MQESPTPTRHAQIGSIAQIRGAISHIPLAARRAFLAMLIASALLLLFNSDGLRSYARDLPANAVSDTVVAFADDWHMMMTAIGFDQPKACVQDWMSMLREARF